MTAQTLEPISAQETQTQIRKVLRFGGIGRTCCTVLIVLLVGLSLWVIGEIAWPGGSHFKVTMGALEIRPHQIASPALKTALLILWAVIAAMWFTGLLQLRALFGNFAAGAIYTRDNVRHIRRLGQLVLSMAVFNLCEPLLAPVLASIGVLDMTTLESEKLVIRLGTPTLTPFFCAALVLLASWIMDVGRATRDEAEQMRKEAELVV
jgi:hypothetical protein